jgi:hypothetical protein
MIAGTGPKHPNGFPKPGQGFRPSPAQADPVPTSVLPEFFQSFSRVFPDIGPSDQSFSSVSPGPCAFASPRLKPTHPDKAQVGLKPRPRACPKGYTERHRRGQRISTAVVESMVNRVIGRRRAKKQPMRPEPARRPLTGPDLGGRTGRALAPSVSTLVAAL